MRNFLLYITLLFSFPLCGQVENEKVIQIVDHLISANLHIEALTAIERAIADQPNKKDYHLINKKTEVLIALGYVDLAQEVLNDLGQEPLAEIDKAITFTNHGYLLTNKGRNDLAIENFQRANEIFTNIGLGESKESARNLGLLGLTYLYAGKYKQAESFELRSLQIRESLFGNKNEYVAAGYNDMGLVYSPTDPDKALEYYDMALASYEALYGKDHPKIAIGNTNIGILYQGLELYGDAINSFESALEIWKKTYPEGHPNQAFVQRNLGQTYNLMGDQKVAMEFFELALSGYRKAYGEKHPDIASTLNQMGYLRLNQDEYEEAITYLQEALIANVPPFANKDQSTNPHIKEFYNGNVLLYSLHIKAKTLENKYYGKTLKLSDLLISLNTLLSADSLIDKLRQSSLDESDKIALGSIANEVYEDGVHVAIMISENVIKSKKYKEFGFYFAEKSKAAVLQASIADSEAKSFAGIPEDLLQDEKKLKAEIAFHVQKLAQKPAEEEEDKFRKSLFNLNAQYAAFTKKLETDFPNYFNLKYRQTNTTSSDLQGLIDDETAIISYMLAENLNQLYVFVITKKRMNIYHSTLDKDYEKYVRGFNNALFFNHLDVYNKSVSQLSKLLVPRIPKSVQRLIIIPSGRLGTIPFEALSESAKITWTAFHEVPFLIKKYGISYEFSAGLLNQKGVNEYPNKSPSVFLCAPVKFPAKDQLAELPGTEKEVSVISDLFGGNVKSIVTFNEANETAIKSGNLAMYDYLHFATHGIVDEMEPELSCIFLSESKDEDGSLYTGEIFNLELNAEMVVLSACQTGLGKLSKGEGVIGLSRALAYAGARNIIVSFWTVADESTTEMMTDFYKIRLSNPTLSFSEALQKAKLNMITQGKFSSPYYWAPFVLIGQ